MDTTRIMNPSPAVDCPELEFEMIIAQIETIQDYALFLEDSVLDIFDELSSMRTDYIYELLDLDNLIEEMEAVLYKEPEAEAEDEDDYSWDYVTSEYRYVPTDFILTCPSCGKSYDIRDYGFRPMLCDRPIPISRDTYLETFRFADYGDGLYYADGSARARAVSIHKCNCGCLTCTTPVFNSDAENMTEYVQLFIMDKDDSSTCFVYVTLYSGHEITIPVEYNRVRGLDMRTLKLFVSECTQISPDRIWNIDIC